MRHLSWNRLHLRGLGFGLELRVRSLLPARDFVAALAQATAHGALDSGFLLVSLDLRHPEGAAKHCERNQDDCCGRNRRSGIEPGACRRCATGDTDGPARSCTDAARSEASAAVELAGDE